MVGTSVAQKQETFKIEPWDEYNQETVANVHPNDWVNPDPASRYNLVVVGAGTAGLVSALGSVGLGAKVALIEKDMMGGDCLNVGCVPSKALIRASRVAAEVRSADTYGVNVPDGVSVDFPKVMERMRRLRAGIARMTRPTASRAKASTCSSARGHSPDRTRLRWTIRHSVSPKP